MEVMDDRIGSSLRNLTCQRFGHDVPAALRFSEKRGKSKTTISRPGGVLIRGLVVVLLVLVMAANAVAQNPLEPSDTSSPRATINSFLVLTQEVSRRYIEYRLSPSPATQAALSQVLKKAWRLLDLSQISSAARQTVADENFMLIWDVIARLKLPDLKQIPGPPADRVGAKQSELPMRWRIPGTEITIARVEGGPRAGEFLFSPDTVARAQEFFESVRTQPYLRPVPTENLYRAAQLFTGWMIPLAWVEALPNWANTPILGQVAWKWLAVLLLFGLYFVAVMAIFRWSRRGSRDGSLRSSLRDLSAPLAILILVPLVRYFLHWQINVTGSLAGWPDYYIELAASAALIWVVWIAARSIAEAIIASPRISPESLDAHLIRLGARVIGFVVMFVLVVRVLNDVGIPVYGLVAGAGVGGLAVALAARSTLENFMGTLNLYADRPVRVGDLCRFGEDPTFDWRRLGTVEEIGLRSTRIRGVDRTITTIPNAEFSNMHIVNLTRRDRMLLRKIIGLRYETTPDQFRLVLGELRKMLIAHPRIVEDQMRVRAIGFGSSSLDLEIFAYVKTRYLDDFLAVQEDVVLRIMEIVKEAGTSFAFPSQTVYHTRDSGLDPERQQAAENQVREWIAANALPFPDFTSNYRQEILDTLDYPPEGSAGSHRG